MIQVTKTFLPPLEDYLDELRPIWESAQVTNHGPLVSRLEKLLQDYLGVRHVLLVCNGTVALQIAIRALGLAGEVITTPFSYVATTSSLVWEGCTPVFTDIEPDSLCLDPALIEARCSDNTTGIIATHVYGNACDVGALQDVAKDLGLRVLYDAAHAFGATYKGRSLAAFGDVSTLSFHATKLFHTGEGGAIVTDDDKIAARVRSLRNFGHAGQEAFAGLGINGKMSELNAAMGLALFSHIPEVLQQRRHLAETYDLAFEDSRVGRPVWREGLVGNCAYYPILLPSEARLLDVRARLQATGVFPRRYFFPALTTLPYVAPALVPVTDSVAARVLCLPMGHDVTPSRARQIAQDVIKVSAREAAS